MSRTKTVFHIAADEAGDWWIAAHGEKFGPYRTATAAERTAVETARHWGRGAEVHIESGGKTQIRNGLRSSNGG